jgi:hypothetical protein
MFVALSKRVMPEIHLIEILIITMYIRRLVKVCPLTLLNGFSNLELFFRIQSIGRPLDSITRLQSSFQVLTPLKSPGKEVRHRIYHVGTNRKYLHFKFRIVV